MAKKNKKPEAVAIERVFSVKEATHVFRNPTGPWEWPEPVRVMISDSFQVLGRNGMGVTAANGDPLSFAFALNALTTLYKLGYAVVKVKDGSRL
jgi:hypothetical protein